VKMKELGLLVMEALAVGLGVTEDEWADLKGKVDDSFWVMRVIGYPPLPNDHDGYSCGAHKDYGCLTFLHADDTEGALQVFLSSSSPAFPTVKAQGITTTASLPREEGGEGVWLNADPIPGCVVCNVGEMWEIWSQGLYRSALHRVVHRGANYRVSVPFFFEPNFNSYVAPLPAAARAWEEYADKLARPQPDDVLVDPVVYGEWLRGKVAGNFEVGKGRYD